MVSSFYVLVQATTKTTKRSCFNRFPLVYIEIKMNGPSLLIYRDELRGII